MKELLMAKNLALGVLVLSVFWFILDKILGRTNFTEFLFFISILISLILVSIIFILIIISISNGG